MDMIAILKDLAAKPASVGRFLWGLRQCLGLNAKVFAQRMQITETQLLDLETGRAAMSLPQAIWSAKTFKLSLRQFVEMVLQEMVTKAGLKFIVEVKSV